MAKKRRVIYGRVTLTAAHIEAIRTSSSNSILQAKANLDASTGEAERTFYTGILNRLQEYTAAYAKFSPGKIGFTEDELRWVIGIVSSARLARFNRWKDLPDGPERSAVSAEVDFFDQLKDRLDLPFLRDTSHDADPEENDDEGDGND